MTEKLYYLDSHMKSFSAKVLSCEPVKDRFAVVLDKTAFFPEGGGQTSDTGFLNDIRVLDVQEDGASIVHYLEAEIPVGVTVEGILDFEDRFRKMQNHSGEHIISGVVNSLFGYTNVGFHLGTADVTVDYDGELTREDLDKVEMLSNEAVARNMEIITMFPDSESLKSMEYRSKLDLTENVRIVKIGDVDVCACCAPHVSYTGEIGAIKILDFERYKGGIRLHMLCGFDAVDDYRVKYTNVQKISNLLKVPQTETADAVERMLDTLKEKDFEIGGLKKKLALVSMRSAEVVGGNLCFVADETCDMDSIRQAVNEGVEKCSGVCVGLCSTEQGFRYCIGSKTLDLRKMSGVINKALQGRGGGQSTMIQGTAQASLEDILAYFSSVLTQE